MAITMLRRLEPFCNKLVLNCRVRSQLEYATRIEEQSWSVPCQIAPNHDTDFLGPLAGICASRPFLNAECLLVPCDMPTLPIKTLETLCRQGLLYPEADALYIQHQGIVEPLISLLRPAALNYIVSAFQDGERSMRRLLFQLACVAVDVPEAGLCNLNDPQMIQINEWH